VLERRVWAAATTAAPPVSRVPRGLADVRRQPVGEPLLVVDFPFAPEAVERDRDSLLCRGGL